mgnify:CR=1 FL=1
MFDRDWSFGLAALVAVVVAFVLGVALGVGHYCRNASCAADLSVPLLYSAAGIEVPAVSNDPDRDEWRKERGLQAQTRTAISTEGMFYVAVAGLFVTGAGIIYVAKNLRETREANRIARHAVSTENRPWVIATDWKVDIDYQPPEHIFPLIIADTPDVFHVRISYKIENVGKFPAAHISTPFRIGSQDRWAELDAIADPSEGPFLAPGQSAPRSANAVIPLRDLVRDQDSNSLPGQRAFFPFNFMVSIRYGFDGGQRCISEYEWVIGFDAEEGGSARGWVEGQLTAHSTPAAIALYRTRNMT